MGRNYIYNQRKVTVQNHKRQVKECERILDWRTVVAKKCAPLDGISFVGLGNSSKVHNTNTMRKNRPTIVEYCEKMSESHDKSSYGRSDYATSMIDSTNDLRSSENVLNEWNVVHCKMINLSNKLRSQTFQDSILEKVKHFDAYSM